MLKLPQILPGKLSTSAGGTSLQFSLLRRLNSMSCMSSIISMSAPLEGCLQKISNKPTVIAFPHRVLTRSESLFVYLKHSAPHRTKKRSPRFISPFEILSADYPVNLAGYIPGQKQLWTTFLIYANECLISQARASLLIY